MTYISHVFKCLTLAALVVILVMSLRPSVPIGDVPNIDKLVHFGAYAVLAVLMRLGWPKLWGGWIFIGLALFGIGIEIGQHAMNLGRTGSLADTAANLLGTAFPLLIFHFDRPLRKM
jgi:VanZ family protein